MRCELTQMVETFERYDIDADSFQSEAASVIFNSRRTGDPWALTWEELKLVWKTKGSMQRALVDLRASCQSLAAYQEQQRQPPPVSTQQQPSVEEVRSYSTGLFLFALALLERKRPRVWTACMNNNKSGSAGILRKATHPHYQCDRRSAPGWSAPPAAKVVVAAQSGRQPPFASLTRIAARKRVHHAGLARTRARAKRWAP